ncbi:hypothetical protein [Psychroserpens damuponensis]|uniref:hypothetical protein n=1 Tax=Psychroserpens damuponensis TaxID=943936 RepID=UPI00058ADA64|nr:hypothetical protein [Psychroserpens damuponensis]
MEQPNLSYIHSMSGGDEAFEKQLIDIIKVEFPEEKKVYFKNMAENNNKLSVDIVHKLKHKISILGLEKSYDVAVQFENNLIEGSTELQDEFELILATMTDFLEQF